MEVLPETNQVISNNTLMEILEPTDCPNSFTDDCLRENTTAGPSNSPQNNFPPTDIDKLLVNVTPDSNTVEVDDRADFDDSDADPTYTQDSSDNQATDKSDDECKSSQWQQSNPEKWKKAFERNSVNKGSPMLSLGERRICKSFFLKTLDISSGHLTTALADTDSGTFPGDDKRGKHPKYNKTSNEYVTLIKEQIESFPESHYTRCVTKRKYLDQKLNILKMYSLYKAIILRSYCTRGFFIFRYMVIPKELHSWYKSLPTSNQAKDSVPEPAQTDSGEDDDESGSGSDSKSE
ncbi:hypothetical protein LOTGIDRAFT_169931 [Lottia gigantea]|uniref:Uncharacterized protein n=1 Tax=Lottia gigantea TaxID=225164 RepID=V3ZNM6_LOTGI|nr:hypothetical protein LOTGIDRAFT_169931 [Lottia gigantea]ESO82461.1 hypothetical protein LOTGIDRAFT_169931 [Lottia gigantea]